jgi:uncharacterized protein (DUF1501 family)
MTDDTVTGTCSCGHDGPAGPADGATPAGMSRRRLLGAAGAAVALGVVGGVVRDTASTRLAFAGPAYTGDVLVVLSLRGGFDGLSAVVPAADPAYVAARPGIAVPAGRLQPLDATFGMHPALAPLKPLWDAGVLGAVHAAGQPDPTRSHFKAMEEMERAAPGSSVRTGWLDRVSAAQGSGGAFATVGVGSDANQRAFVGPSPELLVGSVKDFTLAGAKQAEERARWTRALEKMHRGARPSVARPARLTLNALGTAAALQATEYVPANGAAYPRGDLGDSLRDVARLVKAGVGLRVATVDFGDWDMHQGLGRVDGGWMTRRLTELGSALAAFATDLGGDLSRVTLVTLSEFGRRVRENASGGLDHGHGNLMLMLGGGVVGGRMHGAWRGLSPGALLDGDLPAANDYRTVLAEILERRCFVPASAAFPGLGSARLGVARSR